MGFNVPPAYWDEDVGFNASLGAGDPMVCVCGYIYVCVFYACVPRRFCAHVALSFASLAVPFLCRVHPHLHFVMDRLPPMKLGVDFFSRVPPRSFFLAGVLVFY